MAGFITMAQAVMSVVGGVPVQPAGGNTIIEKLRAAKSMIPGEMGGILNKIMKDGPGAILQNPIAGIQGALQGQLGSLTGALGALPGGGLQGVMGALTGAGGLQGALGQLGNVSGMLSGIMPTGAGQFGLLDAIGHGNLTSLFGSQLPAGLGINTAMGPLLMGDKLQAMSSQFGGMAQGLLNGSVSEGQAISMITGMTGQITNTIDASNNAFATIQGQAVAIAQTAGLVSMIASGPPELAPIANLLIREEHKAEIQAAMNEQIRTVDV